MIFQLLGDIGRLPAKVRSLKAGDLGLVALVTLVCSCLAVAAPQDFSDEVFLFQSGEVVLEGTLLVPGGSGRKTAVVLLSGSGPGGRTLNQAVAEGLARAGFVVLRYDKRTVGYSASAVGQRSYALLADDAQAAVAALRQRRDVNPFAVGLWGISEGAWVAPLAAAQSDDIAFIVTVGAIGVAPAAQVAWSVEEALVKNGVTSRSTRRALVERATRFMVASGEMDYLTYDPVPALERVQQPLLALWGGHDTFAPPAESARIMQQALERGGNSGYRLDFIPDADHNIYRSRDGFTRSGGLAPGYLETMTSWINAVVAGESLEPVVGALPDQARSTPDVLTPGVLDAWYVQMAFMAVFVLAFAGYAVTSGWRVGRTRSATGTVRRAAWVVAVGGSAVWVGTYWYVFATYVTMTDARLLVEPVLAGRPLPWLLLQIAAFVVVVAAVVTAREWWRARRIIPRREHLGISVLLFGAALFVPWALHWSLLVP